MTTTPFATIAEALIEFILSLLRDPSAAQVFAEAPERALADRGLSDVRVEDVRAVVPVIVERAEVELRPATPLPPVVYHTVAPQPVVQARVAPAPEPPPVVKEILNVTNSFHIDNRSTIIDQSVNQSIWAEGDVTQIFDQEAIVAAGDTSVAAGDDVVNDSSRTDIVVGDVAIGNTETSTQIQDSFNNESTNLQVVVDTEVRDSFNQEATAVTVDAEVTGSFQSDNATLLAADPVPATDTVFATDPVLATNTVLATDTVLADPVLAAETAIDDPLTYVAPVEIEVDMPIETEI